MKNAIAIAAPHENPFMAAKESAGNLGKLIIDFMYGTPERSRATFWFAIGLSVLGYALSSAEISVFRYCPA